MEQNFSQPNITDAAPVNPVPQSPLPEIPASNDNKKRGPIFYVVAGLIGVAAIIAIIIFANMIINANKKQSEPQKEQTVAPVEQPEEKKTMTAAEKEAAAKDVLASLKTAAEKSVGGTVLKFQDIYDTYFPYYVPKNAKTGLQLDKAFSIYYNSESTNDINVIETAAEAVRDKLDELGFVEYDEVALAGGPQYIDEETGVICGTVSSGIPFIITCGHTSWITTEKLAFVNSLAEAYYEKMQKYPDALNASKSDIVDSVFEPYQRLIASMPDAGAVFYRSSPTASWVFFAAGQAAPTCAEYAKDTGARRAFQGQTCLNASGQVETITAG